MLNEQKARRSNAVFSRERRLKKKKMNLSNPAYQSMVFVIKRGNRFINSISIFFPLSKNIYHATEKTAEMS